jgi:hypothetical protein
MGVDGAGWLLLVVGGALEVTASADWSDGSTSVGSSVAVWLAMVDTPPVFL